MNIRPNAKELTEMIEVICIDAGRKDLTKDKTYQVKQSKYTNMYELVDDTGHVDTYFKTRFELTPQENIGDGAIENSIKKVSEELKESVIKSLEGEKVEDKKIKVRCIKNNGFENILKENEIYTVKKKVGYRYVLEETGESYEFNQNRFEKVKEDILMVECIWSDGTLELNKIYPVIREDKEKYIIKNDFREEKPYYKDMFEPRLKEEAIKAHMEAIKELQEVGKKVKEYTFEEVIANIKANEKYKSVREVFAIKTIEKDFEGQITFHHNGGFEKEISNHTSQKFIKVEEPKPVSTAEAFKAYEEGKEIESLVTHYRYKKDIEGRALRAIKNKERLHTDHMTIKELENQWLIIE